MCVYLHEYIKNQVTTIFNRSLSECFHIDVKLFSRLKVVSSCEESSIFVFMSPGKEVSWSHQDRGRAAGSCCNRSGRVDL